MQGNPGCRSPSRPVAPGGNWAAEWGGACSELRGSSQLHRGVDQGTHSCAGHDRNGCLLLVLEGSSTAPQTAIRRSQTAAGGSEHLNQRAIRRQASCVIVTSAIEAFGQDDPATVRLPDFASRRTLFPKPEGGISAWAEALPTRKSAPPQMRWGLNGSLRLPVILRMLPGPGCRPRPCRGPVRQPVRAAVPRSAVSRSSCSNGLPSSSRSSSSRRACRRELALGLQAPVRHGQDRVAQSLVQRRTRLAGPAVVDGFALQVQVHIVELAADEDAELEAADLAQQFLGRPGRHAGARHPDHRPQGIAQAFRTPVRSTMDRGHQVSRVSRLAAASASLVSALSSFSLLSMRIGRCATSDSLA